MYQVYVDNEVMLLLHASLQPLHLLHLDRGDSWSSMSYSGHVPCLLLVVLNTLLLLKQYLNSYHHIVTGRLILCWHNI